MQCILTYFNVLQQIIVSSFLNMLIHTEIWLDMSDVLSDIRNHILSNVKTHL